MDDKRKVSGSDKNFINVHENYELSYWTKKFGITRDELRHAVQAVGTSVKAVTKYLNK
ncbi:DUF3606 domain-containing protein [Mucilaginibacter agri]|uniref:DUF3606 domain-containing protein n=1 Tax=Mucilaginibacter agri TaxID=2695265 RepID=A0A965ZLF5_9SPHI|nr:DUF3606 domain-containing protein [Mucilaginibacter agri]NCD72104.1 DUF3606 domain-containing protein [Mucilaginibacter agri]